MNIDVQSATAKPGLGEIPSHKITVTDITDNTSIYWYVKGDINCPDFDKAKHSKLIELAHAKAMEIGPGGFESFNLQGNDYHLQHVGQNEFIIKVLK